MAPVFDPVFGKFCKKCDVWKPSTKYYPKKGYKEGLDTVCIPCVLDLNKYYAARRKKARGPLWKCCTMCRAHKHRREYDLTKKGGLERKAQCKKCSTAAKTRFDFVKHSLNNGKRLKLSPSELGLTETDYEKLLDGQGGTCGMCSTTITLYDKKEEAVMDYDLVSGFIDLSDAEKKKHVHGVLCTKCHKVLERNGYVRARVAEEVTKIGNYLLNH